METTGVLVLTAGVWVLYCGVTGIPVLATIQKIVSDPAHAAEVLATQRAASSSENVSLSNAALTSALTVGAPAGVTAYNPFAGKAVSSAFGARGGEHQGIDYPVPVGTPLPAAMAGVLSYSTGGRGGSVATIRGSNGYTVEYMHLSRTIPELNGKFVHLAQVIGYSGGAKGAPGAGDSTGPHVHFQVNTPNGTPIDPSKYFGG